MQWVKKNINNFGGDREMITLAGQSSGSFSVAMHILSPLSKGMSTLLFPDPTTSMPI